MSIVYPCDIIVKRYYRGYVHVKPNENDSDAAIRRRMLADILENKEAALVEDPDISYVMEDDVLSIEIDHDGAWSEDDF